MARIVILNGSPRKNGHTAELVRAFAEGAREAGNEVEELYLYGMDIADCRGCEACIANPKPMPEPCAIHDGMRGVYEALDRADVVAFASPIFYWTVTGALKSAVDRTLAMNMSVGSERFRKRSVLLSTAQGDDFSLAAGWHRNFERVLGWEVVGEVLGRGKGDEARALGASIS